MHVIGRHMEGQPKPLSNSNIQKTFTKTEGGYHIRLDDKDNIAWWLEISFTEEELRTVLQEQYLVDKVQ